MRQCGILMPISSLPGPGGIGTMGREAYAFVDFLAEAGQQLWQILPLSPTGYGDSPYQSCSAFAGNPYFIDPELLEAEGLLPGGEWRRLSWGSDPLQVDYAAVYASRFRLLEKAYAAWRGACAGTAGFAFYPPDEYYAFTLKNSSWLPDYALYMAIKRENEMHAWTEWPAPLRDRNPAALAAFSAAHAQEIGFWNFVQYLFSRQWAQLRAYAGARGVRILGDMPIYVAADSADAWAGGALFERDAAGAFARVAGCPPDYFSADGQLWGNPVYDWAYHAKTGYAWWIRRMRYALALYDVVRIDHFRGFDTYWAIPAGSETARTGRWENGPGMALFRALEQALGAPLPIVAEDLGEMFPSVRALLADSGFPGMKVLQFAFGGGEEYLPYAYPHNCVAYPGTHDNDTLAGWWTDGAAPAEREKAAAYLRLKPTAAPAAACAAMIAAVLSSPADTAVIPMYDWLALGRAARINTPGRLGGNWGWRAPAGFTAGQAAAIRAECAVYGRTAPAEKVPAAGAPAAKAAAADAGVLAAADAGPDSE